MSIKKVYIVSVLVLILVRAGFAYEIALQVKDLSSTYMYLAEFNRGKTFVIDTCMIDKKGLGLFMKKQQLHEGMYYLVFPGKISVELLIGQDQDFKVAINAKAPFESLKIEGNKSAELYQQYRMYETQSNEVLKHRLYELRTVEKVGADSLWAVKTQFKRQLFLYREALKSQVDSNDILAVYLYALSENLFPKELQTDVNSTLENWQQIMVYAKKDYLNNIDFSDDRTLYMPIFQKRINHYFHGIIGANPDTIIYYANSILQGDIDPLVYKYLITFLFEKYNPDVIPQFERVYIYLAQHYYLNDKCNWIKPVLLQLLSEKVGYLEKVTIGANIEKLPHRQGEINLQKTGYTVLVFWRLGCNDCKSDINYLHKSINTAYDVDFISYQLNKPNQIEGFVNIPDTWEQLSVAEGLNAMKEWNITKTPTFWILKEGEIMYKTHIGHQVVKYLDQHVFQ